MTHLSRRCAALAVVCLYLAGAAVSTSLAREPHDSAAEKVDSAQINRAIRQLSEGDWMQQCEAIALLGQWRAPQGVAPLKEVVRKHKLDWMRGRAMVALAKTAGKDVLADAIRFSRDKSVSMRSAGTEALGIIGGEVAIKEVGKHLDDTDLRTRYLALEAYARHYRKEAWSVVAPRLAKPDRTVLRLATRALAHMATPESLERIRALLATGGESEQIEVLHGLEGIGDKRLIHMLLVYRGRVADGSRAASVCEELLGSYGADVLAGPLGAVLKGEEVSLYAPVARLLVRACPRRELRDALVAAMKRHPDLSPAVLDVCLGAMAAEDNPQRHQAFFASYLEHTDPKTRQRAVRCLSACPKADLFALFRKRISDTDASVVRAAVEALRKAPYGTVPAEGVVAYLKPVFSGGDRALLLGGMALLGSHGSQRDFAAATTALDRFLGGSDQHLRTAAAEALGKVGGDHLAHKAAAAQGYLADWMIVGTFLNDKEDKGMKTVYPPEKEIDFAKTYVAKYEWMRTAEFRMKKGTTLEREVGWQRWRVDRADGRVLLWNVTPPPASYVVGYGVAEVFSPAGVEALLSVEGDESFVLWLNGKQIADGKRPDREASQRRHMDRSEQFPEPAVKTGLKVILTKGNNRFLIKVANLENWWWCRLRLTDAKGRAMRLVQGASFPKEKKDPAADPATSRGK